jgi:DDE domain
MSTKTLPIPKPLLTSKRLEYLLKRWNSGLIEQDHRFIKRLTKPGMGFFSFKTAWRTLQGYEIMNMMRKGQGQGVAKGDVRGQAPLIARLFGVTRYAEQSESLPPHFLFLQFLATQPPILHK